MELNAATRLMALMSNSQGGVQDEVVRQLKAGRYQVKTGAGTVQVLNGSPANVAGCLKYRGWAFDRQKMLLTHPSIDYHIKLSQSGDTTTLKILD